MRFEAFHVLVQQLGQSFMVEVMASAVRADDFLNSLGRQPINLAIDLEGVMSAQNKLEESEMRSEEIEAIVINLFEFLALQVLQAKIEGVGQMELIGHFQNGEDIE